MRLYEWNNESGPEVCLLTLLRERLGVRFAIRIEEFLAALLPRSLFLTL